MKIIAYVFFIALTLPANRVFAEDKGSNSVSEYEIMIKDYPEIEKNMDRNVIPPVNQVIIFDTKGNITRQIDIEEDLELSKPAILKPVIDRAEFLTMINGVYYYICHKT